MRLSFRSAAHLSIIALTGVAFLVLTFFLWYFSGEKSRELQTASTDERLALMERMLENETRHLAVKQSDWARWDDTYTFMSDHNDAYIASNLNNESFVSLDVDIIAFVNNAGELIYGKQVSDDLGSAAIPEVFLRSFVGKSVLSEFASLDETKQGILVTSENMLLLVARPITTSDGTGGKRGTLFFGRYIDEAFIASLSALSGAKVTLAPYGFGVSQGGAPDFRSRGSSAIEISEGSVSGWLLLDNIFGNPSVILGIEQPATFLTEGMNSFQSLARVLFFWMLAYIGLLLICAEVFVIRKIEKIKQVVSRVNDLHPGGAREGKLDDFSYLASVMAGAIEKVDQSNSLADVTWNEITKFRMALDEGSDHTIITDAEGTIIYANVAAEKMTGYSRLEMQGKTPALWGQQMPSQFYAEFWDTIRRRKLVFEGTVTNKHKSGALYSAHLRVIPVLDDKKRVLNFIGMEYMVKKC